MEENGSCLKFEKYLWEPTGDYLSFVQNKSSGLNSVDV